MSLPIITTTAQAAVFSIASSVMAQGIAAFQSNSSMSLDWHPIFQFFVFAVLSTPPNVRWQVFLESSFPGFSAETQKKGTDGNDSSNSSNSSNSSKTAPRLNWRNTLAKTLLDQTVGASVNVLLLCAFVATWEQGLQRSDVVAAAVVGRARADFWPLLVAGWRFWPWISLGSFALLPDVASRNLVGGIAGIAWGVYLSLATAPPVRRATE